MTTATELLQRLGGRPVGVVGLGLIGGSLGLDLRQLGVAVRGWAHRPATAERALARGLVDQASVHPQVLQDCPLVLLALPLDQLVSPSLQLLQGLPPEALVMDMGSVKRPVLLALQDRLPRFVACHPMAGTASAGVEAGVAGLFAGRPWVLTPTGQEDPEDLALARSLGEALEAVVLECDAASHDRAVALISHMPVLVSAALLSTATAAESSALAQALASSGFADTTRIGGGNPQLGTLMARCNREGVLRALEDYQRQLEQLRCLVSSDNWEGLEQHLRSAQAARPGFL
tara:strand:+ start:10357 stop:11223 length:867 start_codon:yes stop_codon:yes gene_type:complete